MLLAPGTTPTGVGRIFIASTLINSDFGSQYIRFLVRKHSDFGKSTFVFWE